jgi:hypothetical protein
MKTMYLNYIVIVISLTITIISLVIGLKYQIERFLYVALLFGALGSSLLISTRVYIRLNRIIMKMEQAIAELRKGTE